MEGFVPKGIFRFYTRNLRTGVLWALTNLSVSMANMWGPESVGGPSVSTLINWAPLPLSNNLQASLCQTMDN